MPTVNVAAYWNGHHHGFELSSANYIYKGKYHDGVTRLRVRGEKWDREVATEALDILEKVYGYERRTIRFHHK